MKDFKNEQVFLIKDIVRRAFEMGYDAALIGKAREEAKKELEETFEEFDKYVEQ